MDDHIDTDDVAKEDTIKDEEHNIRDENLKEDIQYEDEIKEIKEKVHHVMKENFFNLIMNTLSKLKDKPYIGVTMSGYTYRHLFDKEVELFEKNGIYITFYNGRFSDRCIILISIDEIVHANIIKEISENRITLNFIIGE